MPQTASIEGISPEREGNSRFIYIKEMFDDSAISK
jgi:hypothetical protein